MAGVGQRFPVVKRFFKRNVPCSNTRGQDTQSLSGVHHGYMRNVADTAAVRGVVGGVAG